MTREGCLAAQGFVYHCIRHDADWPSGWTYCRFVRDGGRPAQPGDPRTNGVRPAAGGVATPVVARVRTLEGSTE